MSGIVLQPSESNIWRIVQSIIQLAQGRVNCVGQVTLTAGQTTTVVTKAVDPGVLNCSKDCEVFLTPRTADAAAEMAAGGLYISDMGQGTFTITHANDVSTTRTFGFLVLG